MLIENPWPSFVPRIGPVPKMCKTCPFHPSNLGYGADHPDFKPGGSLLTVITSGAIFTCHKTVFFHPDTKYIGRGRGRQPAPAQAHFRHCLGAVLYKQGKVHAPGTNPLDGRD